MFPRRLPRPPGGARDAAGRGGGGNGGGIFGATSMNATSAHPSSTPGRQDISPLRERVRAGDEGAVRELVAVFGPSLLHAARARLPQKLRAKYDSQDIVQDVWASFFGGLP